jgi:predicted tellurium resistance membrane protein TerC
MHLTEPVLYLSRLVPAGWLNQDVDAVSIKDLILLAGGLFLIWKSVHEIHNKFQGEHDDRDTAGKMSFGGVLVQIAMMDVIFSLDSVITAVGMVQETVSWP